MLSPTPRRRCVVTLLLLIALWLPPSVAHADHKLEESTANARVFSVVAKLNVSGQLETAAGNGKATSLKLAVNATHRFRERRLPPSGRDAEALRSLRFYDSAEAKIEVSQQTTFSKLRNQCRTIVAHGQREGMMLYSPQASMTAGEVELLQMPGDVLSLLALLPYKNITVGETWNVSSWAIQMLSGADAVLKSEMKCKLESVTSEQAKVTFAGSIEGAIDGAVTEITITGHYDFDLTQNYITRFELTQKEKRSVGAVTPGMNVIAKIVVERTLADNPGPLTDKAVTAIPLEPNETATQLLFQSPWNIQFHHDRNWHMFHQSNQVAVLRLLDKGALIAQCNVSKITDASPGKHTSEEQFQKDISVALGERLKTIEKAELLKVEDGRFLYRVTAVGESNKVPMRWIYYLCAAPDGRQIAFVFAVESKLVERLGNRDLGIVGSLRFLPKDRVPAAASR